MRYVEIIPGVRSSALGFGCAGVCGSVDKARALKAIHSALDCGINHFDLAPSYGYGAAESVVGAALPANRESVVIGTKFGISPTILAKTLKPLKGVARQLTKNRTPPPVVSNVRTTNSGHSIGLKASLKSAFGSLLFKRQKADPSLMERSFYQSLRRMKLEYIDYLMIHEPMYQLDNLNELLRLAETLKSRGCLRGFGIAISEGSYALHRAYMKEFDFIQMPGSPQGTNYERAKEDAKGQGAILYSVFQGLGSSQGFNHSQVLGEIQSDFPSSVLLCSMFNPVHIELNARAFSEI